MKFVKKHNKFKKKSVFILFILIIKILYFFHLNRCFPKILNSYAMNFTQTFELYQNPVKFI